MAIWTENDIAKLSTAVASGVLEVEYEGPPRRRVKYHTLTEMLSLLSRMIADVRGARRVRLAKHSKGV